MKSVLHPVCGTAIGYSATNEYSKDPYKTETERILSSLLQRSKWKIKEAAGGDADGRSISMAGRKRGNKSLAKLENASVAKKGAGTKSHKSLIRATKVSNASTAPSDPLEAIQNLDHLFIRHSRNRESFFQYAERKYDLVDINGVHRYYAMEVKGSGEAGGNGEGERVAEVPDRTISVMNLDGRELLLVKAFRPEKATGSRFSLYRQDKCIGEIVQTSDSCSELQFDIIGDDERGFGVVLPSEESKSTCSCLNFFGTKLTLTEDATFEIHLPSRRRRMGRIGKIAHLIAEAPAQFKTWYGVEFNKEVQMGVVDRLYPVISYVRKMLKWQLFAALLFVSLPSLFIIMAILKKSYL